MIETRIEQVEPITLSHQWQQIKIKKSDLGLLRIKLRVLVMPSHETEDSGLDAVAGDVELKVTPEAWARALTRAPRKATTKREKEIWLRNLALGKIIDTFSQRLGGGVRRAIVGKLDQNEMAYETEILQWMATPSHSISPLRSFEDSRWYSLESPLFENDEVRESDSRDCWEQTSFLCDGLFGSNNCLLRWRCKGYERVFGRLDWDPEDPILSQILENLLEIKVRVEGQEQDPDLAVWGCFTRQMSIKWQSERSLENGALETNALSEELEKRWIKCFDSLGASKAKVRWTCKQVAQYSAQIVLPKAASQWSQKRLWEGLKEIWQMTEAAVGKGCTLSHPPTPEMLEQGVEGVWQFEQELRELEQKVKEGLGGLPFGQSDHQKPDDILMSV